jgi:hypothetical protein
MPFDTVAVIGDQLQLRPRLRQQHGIDPVGDGGHQHFGALGRLDQLGLGHRPVLGDQARIEQFSHARLDHVRQGARDDHERAVADHRSVPFADRKDGVSHAADLGRNRRQPQTGWTMARFRCCRAGPWLGIEPPSLE